MEFRSNIFNRESKIFNYNGIQIYPMAMVLSGAIVGEGTRIQSFSIIEPGARIGHNCTIRARNTIIGGVTMGDNVFVGSGVEFIDRRYPRNNHPEDPTERTYIHDDVVIGVNATIFPVTIWEGALIGAASLVLADVPPGAKVKGEWK